MSNRFRAALRVLRRASDAARFRPDLAATSGTRARRALSVLTGLLLATGIAPAFGQSSTPINQLPIASAINPSDYLLLDQSGTTKRAAASNFVIPGNNLSDLPDPATALGNLGAAPINSPNLLGTPTAPTPSSSDDSTRLATTAYVKAQGYLSAIPYPGSSSLGESQSLAPISHKWVTGLSTGGVLSTAQPSFGDLTGNPTSSQITTGLGSTTANTFLAGPASGSAATGAYRAMVPADVPTGSGLCVADALIIPCWSLVQPHTATVASLRGLTASIISSDGYTTAETDCYYAAPAPCSGGSKFVWNATSTATDDGGSVVDPTGNSGAGRWLAVFSAQPLIEQFGADPTAATDSSAAILACANYVSTNGGGYCRSLSSSKILIASSITFPAASGLECSQGHLGNPGTDWTASPYGNLGGIRLASTATITYNSMFVLRNCLVYRNGMTFPAADASAYAGTAFQSVGGVGANDAKFEDALIIGFNLPLNHVGDRLTLDGFYADGTNCMVLGNSYDSTPINHVHCYPYGTVATNGCGAGTTNCQRSGTGISISGESDDTTLGDDVLVLGYLTDFYIDGTNIHIGKIWSDYAGTPNAGAVGVLFGPAADQVTADDILAYSSTVGVNFSSTTGRIQIGNMLFQSNAGDCMQGHGGIVKITSLVAHGCGGWYINDVNTTGDLSVLALDFRSFGSSSEPSPIAIGAGITTDHAYFGRITSDGSFASAFSGSLLQPTIAISGTFLTLGFASNHFIVSSASGTVNSMTSREGGNIVTLQFDSGIVLTQGTGCSVGQLQNTSGANITTTVNGVYTYYFDAVNGGCWRQQS